MSRLASRSRGQDRHQIPERASSTSSPAQHLTLSGTLQTEVEQQRTSRCIDTQLKLRAILAILNRKYIRSGFSDNPNCHKGASREWISFSNCNLRIRTTSTRLQVIG